MDKSAKDISHLEELTLLHQQYSELKTAFDTIVSEKKQTEEALWQSEQKFFVLFEKYPFPTSLSKLPKGIIVNVNEAFEHEFGFKRQEVLGKTLLQLCINLNVGGLIQILKKLRQSSSVHHQEMVLRSKSGEESYYETNVDKILINGEEYLLNTTQNIGEYKRAQNKLKENYNLLRMSGEKAKLGGWNVILNENLTYWSDEVASIHEMQPGYIPPVQDGINFYAPEWRTKITEVFGNCAKHGIPYDEEMEIITAKGRRLWVRTIGEAVYDVNGKIVKVQGAFQDISTLKQTQEIIKQDKELLNNFFKQSLTGFFIMKIDEPVIWNDGVDKEKVLDYVFEHQHFVKVNQAMLHQYLASEADFLNKTPKDLFAQDIKQGRKVWKELFDKGSIHTITKEKRFDGSSMWVEGDYICLYDSLGRISGHFGNQQDITERMKAEMVLKEAKNDIEKSEHRYRTVVSNSPVVTFVLNLDGIFTLSEGKGLEKLNLKPGQVVGQSAFEFYKDFPLIINDIKKALTGKVLRSETVLPGVVFDIMYNPVFDNYGNLIEVIGVANDMTEHKQADIQIKKHKSELEEYFENDISADYVVSVSGEIFSCNKTFLSLFGFEKKSDTEKFDITNLYKNPKDREQMIALVKKQRKVENLEMQFISKEGKTINAIINAIGIFDKEDKLEKIRGYVVDITEQKRIEKELYKSEEKYRLLFANNPQPMWIYDLETLAFLEINQAVVDHYGYTRQEFLSMTLNDIRPTEDIYALEQNIKKASSNLNRAGQWRHLKKNGELIKVEITSHSIQFNNRNARHVLINDITERKFFETEHLKLSRVVEQNPASVIITDLDGNMEYVNPKTVQITGYSKEELIGKNPRIFNSGEKSKEEYQQLWSTISSGKEWFGEFLNKKKNGELYWESASISPIFNEKQEIINYVSIKEDITERKKNIEDLKFAKEKAEESDRLKSAFLANMSHEIRTPMNGILGFTQLLLEPDLNSEQKESFIKIVHQSGQRLLSTVNDIVEISKIEAGLVRVNVNETDFNKRVEEIFNFFKPEAEKKGLKLILEMLLTTENRNFLTDQNKLDSILTNLIKNAIKYTESGIIKMGCQQKGLYIEFYIKDTGIGIPTDRQNAIFERFIQADIADTKVFEGSGLGLAIAKSYVEMLGGEIWVESSQGIGSTFYFTLPIKQNIEENSRVHDEAFNEHVSSKSNAKKLKILIAEDDEISRNYISLIVNNFSNEILEAKTGIETVELCRNTKGIELILMDIKMPEMNGYDATRCIRQFNKDVVIIAQTAYGLSGNRKKAMEAGCNDYIAKPINKTELQALIQKHFWK